MRPSAGVMPLALLALAACGGVGSESAYRSDLDPPSASSDGCAHWSPDGRMMAFSRSSDFGVDVVVADRTGTRVRRVIRTREDEAAVLGWLEHPTKAVVAQGRDVVLLSIQGAPRPQRLLRLRRGESPVSMSQDGRFLVVEGVDDSSGESVLRAVRVSDGGRVDLAHGFFSGGSFAQRAARVAFVADDQVVVLDLASGRRAAVGSGFLGDMPALSPDGRSLAFARAGGYGVSRIYRAELGPDLGPGLVHVLTGDGDAENTNPVFAPNGRRLLYQHGGDLRAFDLDGGRDEQLTVAGGTGDYCPAISPDGRRIAFVRQVGGLLSTTSALIVMDADGSGKRLVPAGG